MTVRNCKKIVEVYFLSLQQSNHLRFYLIDRFQQDIAYLQQYQPQYLVQVPMMLSSLLSILVQIIMHTLLLFTINYTLFTLITNLHASFQSLTLTTLAFLWVLFTHFNTLFNYHMAVNVDPGNSKDIPLDQFLPDTDYCLKCEYPVPQYGFHCSICNKCTLQLDHHCPWISCIGRENRRYFVNYITYTWVYLLNIAILIQLGSSGNSVIIADNDEVLIKILCLTLFGLLFCFSMFHWILVFRGTSSIRMCRQDGVKQERGENIERVFGVKSLLLSLLPSGRELKHSKGGKQERETGIEMGEDKVQG